MVKEPTHNERVLRLLSDGKPHSHHELYALHVVAHSRVSDLRKQGHTIEQWREGDLYLYRLLGGGDVCWRELAHSTTVPSTEQLTPPISPDVGCSTIPAPEWLGKPALSPSPGGAANDGTHPSRGAEAGRHSGDTAAGRVAWHAAGNGSCPSASPEQLSIDDALTERGDRARGSVSSGVYGGETAPSSKSASALPRSVSAEAA